MKARIFLLFLPLVLGFIETKAQKFGYVDMEYITGKMPEYQKVQAEVDKFSDRWAKEIQDKYADIDRLQRVFQAEEVLLTEDLKKKRLQEITDKEKEAREYNNKIFGFEGMLFQKKKELTKTVTDVVYKSVEKVCRVKRLDFLFDKSSDFVVIYSNPTHDYTDYVMEDLGLNKDNKKETPSVEVPVNKTSVQPTKESPNKSKTKQ